MNQENQALFSVRASFATLDRAASFLGAGLRTGERAYDDRGRASGIEGPHRAKVIGNGLRELDRFLSLMIDEVVALVAPLGLDHTHFRRQRNTANKLRTIRAAMSLASPEHARLLAISRSSNCLFHCAGIVRRGDSRTAMQMTAGWPALDGTSPHILAIGERLSINASGLLSVCRFYRHVAADLLANCQTRLAAG